MFRVKRTLQPYVEDNEIIFGFGNSSLERRIPYTDETAFFLKKLDNGISDISQLSSNEIILFEKLIKLGLITDNEYNNDKFSRNINFYEWIDTSEETSPKIYQEKLDKTRILILGLGGIGSTLAEILTRMGIGALIIIDYDIVDDSNITRQSAYTNEDIGKFKVDALVTYLKKISDTDLTYMNFKVENKKSLHSIFEKYEFDLAVCCADKPTIKIDYWFDEVSHMFNKPFIIGSYASTVINRCCIIPNETITLNEFYGEYMATDDHLLKSLVPTSIIAPISYMSAGMIAYKVFNFITKLNHTNEAIQLDIIDWRVSKYDLSIKK